MAKTSNFLRSKSCKVEIEYNDNKLTKAIIHQCTLFSTRFELAFDFIDKKVTVFKNLSAAPQMALKIELTEEELTLWAANSNHPVEVWQQILCEEYSQEKTETLSSNISVHIPVFSAKDVIQQYHLNNWVIGTLGTIAVIYTARKIFQ